MFQPLLLPSVAFLGEGGVEVAFEEFAGVGEVLLRIGDGFIYPRKGLIQYGHNPLLLRKRGKRDEDLVEFTFVDDRYRCPCRLAPKLLLEVGREHAVKEKHRNCFGVIRQNCVYLLIKCDRNSSYAYLAEIPNAGHEYGAYWQYTSHCCTRFRKTVTCFIYPTANKFGRLNERKTITIVFSSLL